MTLGICEVLVTVRMALVTTVTAGRGKMVIVGFRLILGTVVVLGLAVDVMVEETVMVSLSTGVVTDEIVMVGGTVSVDCGPTLRKKSRSKSIGSQSPLLEMISNDQSPV